MKVRCIEDCGTELTDGDTYEVVEETKEKYVIINPDGMKLSYFKYRFEKVRE